MTEYSDNLTVADVEAVLRALPDHEITGDEMCPCQNRRPAPDAVARLVGAALALQPYLEWAVGPESPGYHPTMVSAVAAFKEALAAMEKPQ